MVQTNSDPAVPRGKLTRRFSSGYWFDKRSILHPAVILAIAFVTAAAAFLSPAELRDVLGNEIALIKLLAGVALLFFVGIYFAQRSKDRPDTADIRALLNSNAEEFWEMQRALTKARKKASSAN